MPRKTLGIEFSASPMHVEVVREYIRQQPEHHQQKDFQTEYRRFCEKNGKPLDERYACGLNGGVVERVLSRPFSGLGRIAWGSIPGPALRFSPGCHLAGFQPR